MKNLFVIIVTLLGVVFSTPVLAKDVPATAVEAVAPVEAVTAPALALDKDSVGKVFAPKEWGWFFQKAKGELGDRMIDFHNYVFAIITVITIIVIGLMGYIVVKFRARPNRQPSKTTHNTLLEVIWTTIPILIVVAIIVPSMKLLYFVDKTEEADMTLKVVGYQWYWGYELPDQQVAEFESRIIPEKDLKKGDLRLLEVDEPLVLPVGKTIRVLVTGDPNGVIHAWGVPALKFKRDTIPGRINEGWIKIEEPGTYYGQCYELCGPEHAFMPIKIVAVPEAEFNEWVLSKGGKVAGPEITNYAEGTKAIDAEGLAIRAAPATEETEVTANKEGI